MTNLMSERARRMRRDKGPAERKLWYKLRAFNRQGFQFRQQAPIGRFIVDFCDHTAKLIIEVDGGQHGQPKGLASDKRRTSRLESQGYRVLRFWNNEVLKNIEGVEIAIMLALGLLEDAPVAASAARIPSPLVGEGEGGGKPRRSPHLARAHAIGVVSPPTPNPSPQGGGESARRSPKAAETHNA